MPAQDIDRKDQNILIVGNDDRARATDAELKELGTTRDGGSLNTDTMMVMHIPQTAARPRSSPSRGPCTSRSPAAA
jgi:anionic cell wall polymer biosynthesis LytR-Cps2A-Psr (LCP) family protein